MKRITLKDGNDYVSDVVNQINEKGIERGEKFMIRFKPGFRWKLKTFRLTEMYHDHCGSCGDYTVLELKKGEEFIEIDNHFGPSYLLPKLRNLKK